MEEKERSNNGLISLLSSVIYLVKGILILLNNNIDKIGIKILYGRIGLIIAIWVLCAVVFICFFTKKMWKSKQKATSILLLIVSVFILLLHIPNFSDCCADLAGGTESIVTNEYPVVWDKIFPSGSSEEYAYVSDDIAALLNENKVLTITSNLDLQRENYVEVVYYPRTHVLIRAGVVQ